MPDMLIGGRLMKGPHALAVVNPADELPFIEVTAADATMLDAAVAAAKNAFPAWAATPLDRRRALLDQIAKRIEAATDELARLLTLEQGKPIAYAHVEVQITADYFRYAARSNALNPQSIFEDETMRVTVHRRPLGIVACIIPWNFPLAVIGTKAPGALLAGNSVIIKPASTTPVATLRLGEIIADIVPPGLINILVDRDDLGGALTAHPDVRHISFTGSCATGRKVQQAAAAGLKRMTLELGGNDAAIVLEDVDPARILPALFQAAFFNTGQVCVAMKRLYVHDAVYEPIVAGLTQLADAAVIGNGLEQDVAFGPLHNAAQYNKVKTFIADGARHGAITTSDPVPDRPGYFIRPTVVRDIADGCALVDEEQFGPVLPVIRFSDPEDALRRANASPYGLAGSVWSADEDRALALASRMEVGTAWVNKHVELSPTIPFGGAKDSGIGIESGDAGILEFTQAQTVNINKLVG